MANLTQPDHEFTRDDSHYFCSCEAHICDAGESTEEVQVSLQSHIIDVLIARTGTRVTTKGEDFWGG